MVGTLDKTHSTRRKTQYRVIDISGKNTRPALQDELNTHGNQGWKLIAVNEHGGKTWAYFEKPKRD